MRRKNHNIPAEILSEDSLFKDYRELDKRLRRAGFSYAGGKYRFIHNEEGYITHYVDISSPTNETKYKLLKDMRIKF